MLLILVITLGFDIWRRYLTSIFELRSKKKCLKCLKNVLFAKYTNILYKFSSIEEQIFSVFSLIEYCYVCVLLVRCIIGTVVLVMFIVRLF